MDAMEAVKATAANTHRAAASYILYGILGVTHGWAQNFTVIVVQAKNRERSPHRAVLGKAILYCILVYL